MPSAASLAASSAVACSLLLTQALAIPVPRAVPAPGTSPLPAPSAADPRGDPTLGSRSSLLPEPSAAEIDSFYKKANAWPYPTCGRWSPQTLASERLLIFYDHAFNNTDIRVLAYILQNITGDLNATELDLEGSLMGDEGITAISSVLHKMPSLQSLTLTASRNEPNASYPYPFGDAGFSALASALSGVPQLTRLLMQYNRVGDVGLAALAGALANGSLVNLQMLDMSGNRVGDAGIASLSTALASGGLPQLTTLTLNGQWYSRDAGHHIRGTIGPSGVKSLSSALAAGGLAQLTTLTLTGQAFGDDGLTALAAALGGGGLPRIETLTLSDNLYGDDGASALATSASDPSGLFPTWMATLDLSTNNITDTGAAALVAAIDPVTGGGAFAGITQLSVADNHMTDVGVLAFVKALQDDALPNLHAITLEDNDNTKATLHACYDAGIERKPPITCNTQCRRC